MQNGYSKLNFVIPLRIKESLNKRKFLLPLSTSVYFIKGGKHTSDTVREKSVSYYLRLVASSTFRRERCHIAYVSAINGICYWHRPGNPDKIIVLSPAMRAH